MSRPCHYYFLKMSNMIFTAMMFMLCYMPSAVSEILLRQTLSECRQYLCFVFLNIKRKGFSVPIICNSHDIGLLISIQPIWTDLKSLYKNI